MQLHINNNRPTYTIVVNLLRTMDASNTRERVALYPTRCFIMISRKIYAVEATEALQSTVDSTAYSYYVVSTVQSQIVYTRIIFREHAKLGNVSTGKRSWHWQNRLCNEMLAKPVLKLRMGVQIQTGRNFGN